MAMSDSPGGSRHSFCPYWLPWRLHINQFTVVFLFIIYLSVFFFFREKQSNKMFFQLEDHFWSTIRDTHTRNTDGCPFYFYRQPTCFSTGSTVSSSFHFSNDSHTKRWFVANLVLLYSSLVGGTVTNFRTKRRRHTFFLTNGGNTKTLDIINTRTPTLSTKFHNLKLSIKWRPGDLAVNVRPSTGNHGAQLKKIWTEHWNKTQQGRRKLRGSFRED
jgi:hypothetical protein